VAQNSSRLVANVEMLVGAHSPRWPFRPLASSHAATPSMITDESKDLGRREAHPITAHLEAVQQLLHLRPWPEVLSHDN